MVVMKGLADRGHRVDVLSPFPLNKPHPNYTDLSIADDVPRMTNNMNYELVKAISGSSAGLFIHMTGTEICRLLELPLLQDLINNPPKDPPYDLVVTELFYSNCYFAFGRHLGVPVVAITPSPMIPYANEPLGNPLNTAYVSDIEDDSIKNLTFWGRLKNTIITWYRIFQSRYHIEVQNDYVKKYFGEDMPEVRQLERELSLLLVNSHHSLNGVRPFTPAVVEVGGLHVKKKKKSDLLPSNVKKWLDENDQGFVYCSFGSMVKIESFPNETVLQIYSAFSKLSPIRVLMKVAVPESLPPGLPKNVLTMSWLPQEEILMHKNIRAFITHGGLMGVQEAVTYGVPLIGVPLFRDQPINIKNCADKGTAVFLDYLNLTEENILGAVNKVLKNSSFKTNMMDLSARFLDRETPALDTAVFWIEYILRHGGDALRSPAVKLTWWQLALVDVLAVIVASIVLALYLIKIIVSMILSRLASTKKPVLTTPKKSN
ncbi:UDP-glucosyltransferase 2-like isoform X2 [Athalia rosae]|uniref:UDP-glucosyltransferase 2-like isoform X2 n=1 Tax=Athalia rosae TaxID=37344 RepID=UPI002034309E|nr:UDP-glucosyltransferase 2-like isoform X2 [Athalia rosae]